MYVYVTQIPTGIRAFVMVQRVGTAGVMVGQRGVVVVVFVVLQLNSHFPLGAADHATVNIRTVIVVLFAQQRVVAQRELVAGYELSAARVAPKAFHVIDFSLGPHH